MNAATLSPKRAYEGEHAHQLRTLTASDVMEYFGEPEFQDAVDVVLARNPVDGRLIGSLFIAARDLYAAKLATFEVYGSRDTNFRDGRPNTPTQAVAMVFERATSAQMRRAV